jgi:hypothetical protein
LYGALVLGAELRLKGATVPPSTVQPHEDRNRDDCHEHQNENEDGHSGLLGAVLRPCNPYVSGGRALQKDLFQRPTPSKGPDSQPSSGARSYLTPLLATCTAYRKMSTRMTMIIISPRPPPIYMIKPSYDGQQHHQNHEQPDVVSLPIPASQL